MKSKPFDPNDFYTDKELESMPKLADFNKPLTPNNFEEKLKEILKEYAPRAEESYHITGREPFYAVKESDIPNVVKAISTLCEEEVKRARLEEINRLGMKYLIDPDQVFEDRISELEKGK